MRTPLPLKPLLENIERRIVEYSRKCHILPPQYKVCFANNSAEDKLTQLGGTRTTQDPDSKIWTIDIRLSPDLNGFPYGDTVIDDYIPHELAHGFAEILGMNDLTGGSISKWTMRGHHIPWSRIYVALGGSGAIYSHLKPGFTEYGIRLPNSGRLRILDIHTDLSTIGPGMDITFPDHFRRPLEKCELVLFNDKGFHKAVSMESFLKNYLPYTTDPIDEFSPSEEVDTRVEHVLTVTEHPHFATDALDESGAWAQIRAIRRFPFLLAEELLDLTSNTTDACLGYLDAVEDEAYQPSDTAKYPDVRLWALLYRCVELRRILAPWLPLDATLPPDGGGACLFPLTSDEERLCECNDDDTQRDAPYHCPVPFRVCCLLHDMLWWGNCFPCTLKERNMWCKLHHTVRYLILHNTTALRFVERDAKRRKALLRDHFYGDSHGNDPSYTAECFSMGLSPFSSQASTCGGCR